MKKLKLLAWFVFASAVFSLSVFAFVSLDNKRDDAGAGAILLMVSSSIAMVILGTKITRRLSSWVQDLFEAKGEVDIFFSKELSRRTNEGQIRRQREYEEKVATLRQETDAQVRQAVADFLENAPQLMIAESDKGEKEIKVLLLKVAFGGKIRRDVGIDFLYEWRLEHRRLIQPLIDFCRSKNLRFEIKNGESLEPSWKRYSYAVISWGTD